MRSCIHRGPEWEMCEYEDWSSDDGMIGPMCNATKQPCRDVKICPKKKHEML